MANVVIYTTSWCPYCMQAKRLLERKQVAFEEIDAQDDRRREEMIERSGRYTVPQVFIDGRAVGGCDDLYALDASGELDRLLAGNPAA